MPPGWRACEGNRRKQIDALAFGSPWFDCTGKSIGRRRPKLESPVARDPDSMFAILA